MPTAVYLRGGFRVLSLPTTAPEKYKKMNALCIAV